MGAAIEVIYRWAKWGELSYLERHRRRRRLLLYWPAFIDFRSPSNWLHWGCRWAERGWSLKWHYSTLHSLGPAMWHRWFPPDIALISNHHLWIRPCIDGWEGWSDEVVNSWPCSTGQQYTSGRPTDRLPICFHFLLLRRNWPTTCHAIWVKMYLLQDKCSRTPHHRIHLWNSINSNQSKLNTYLLTCILRELSVLWLATETSRARAVCDTRHEPP